MSGKRPSKKNLSKVSLQPPADASPLQLSKEEAIFDGLDDVTPIIEFLENFRQMVDPKAQHPSQLISIKMPVPLLEAFKARAHLLEIPYQTLIKKVMLDYLRNSQ